MSRKEAINYIRTHKNGTLKDLVEHIGAQNVKALESTGYIQRGQEKISRTDTWAPTTMALKRNTQKSNETFTDKILNFINYPLIKNITKPHLV